MTVNIELEFSEKISYVMSQNEMNVLLKAVMTNDGIARDNVMFRLTSEPRFFEDVELKFDLLTPDDIINLESDPQMKIVLDSKYISSLTEKETGHVTATVLQDGEIIGKEVAETQILPFDYWPGCMMPEMVAAFITPNASCMPKIRNDASQILKEWGKSPSLEGYQGDRDRVLSMGAASYAALEKYNIHYVNPPTGFEEIGQRIRIPDEVLTNHEGTCIDLAVLYASVLESIGIHTLVFIVKGHAFAGFWLVDDYSPDILSYDSAAFTRMIRNNEMVAVECTMFTDGSNAGFEDAVNSAKLKLENGNDFICALDVFRARKTIQPLPVRKQVNGEWVVERPEREINTVAPESAGMIYGELETRSLTTDDRWKRQLLDITNRNNLINMKSGTKVTPLMLADISSFEDMFADGSEFRIYPKPQEWDGTGTYNARPFETENYIGNYRLASDSELERKRIRIPMTDLESEKTLRSIYRLSNKELEESGCNSLFVALGMLRWFEGKGTSVARYAPLILIPAGLRKRQDGYSLKKLDEETVFNITLLEKLRQEFGINLPNLDPLPEDDSGVNVDWVLQIVRKSITGKDGWDVLEGAALGVFSFNQYVMWKDLDSNIDVLRQSPVVDCLMDGKPYPSEKDLDEDSDPYGLCLTVPADGSQIKSVKAAGNGKTFVMHGPPGTGKSQTITNMISNALFHDKTVLFVAEKRAALEVVQKRLEEVGIGDHCLELHSNKTEKSKVLDQLRRSLERGKDFDEGKQRMVMDRILAIRGKLDAYVTALHKEQPWGLSAYDCISRYESHDVEGAVDVPVPVGTVKSMSPEAVPALDEGIREAYRAYGFVKGNGCESFRNIGLREPRASVSDDADRLVKSCGSALQRMRKALNEVDSMGLPVDSHDTGAVKRFFSEVSGMEARLAEKPDLMSLPMILDRVLARMEKVLNNIGEMSKLDTNTPVDHANELLTDMSPLEADLRHLVSKGYFPADSEHLRMISDIGEVCNRYIGLKRDIDTVLTTWSCGVFEFNSGYDVAKEWNAANNAKFLGRSKAKKAFMSSVSQYLRNPGMKFDDLASTVNIVGSASPDVIDSRAKLSRYSVQSRNVLRDEAETVRRLASDVQKVISSASMLGIEMNTLPDLFRKVSSSQALLNELTESVDGWESSLSELNAGLSIIDELKGPEDFERFSADLEPHLCDLFDWVNWNRYSGKLRDMGLYGTIELITSDVPVETAVDSTYRSLYKTMITICRQDSDSLRMFSAADFEELISKFKNLDSTYTEYNKKLLGFRLSQKIPHNMDKSVPGTESSILYKAVNSKSMRKSIRSLLSEIPNILPRLFPCLLMSPQSVSQYITMDYPKFDLVIFDESSQITTCKAIGSLGRAKCAVIAGDSKQLPPTSFFQRKIEAVEGEDDDMIDIDSFLDDCLALNMPETYLEWHYRSRHESLIAFSNRMFYDNKMMTFPSPNDQETRVSMVMTNGVYERGRRVNTIEAQAVVDEVYRRIMDPVLCKQSIGIVAFSISQQSCIQDMLDDRISKEPEFFRRFNEMPEDMFVKNLETVQGDERDVIMFSIGYGPTKDGNVYQNFGPINREGGGRRLNVAVSRARREMIVFSSMKYTDIKLTVTSSKGVRSMREFLKFAENGGRFGDVNHAVPRESESSIILDIASVLKDNGYESRFGIGSSEFKVDVAVINPECPNEYMLGILTDGESYRNSSNTRDREYARADVLERLGWNLMHVWSLEWYFNKQNTIDNILEKLKEIEEGTVQCSCLPEIEPVKEPEPDVRRDSIGGTLSSAPVYARANSKRIPYRCKVDSLGKDTTIQFNNSALLNAARCIIAYESPIDMQYLTKLVSRVAGIQRLTAKTREPMERLLLNNLDWDGDDEFITFWDPDMDRSTYDRYRYNDGENKREIEQISGPEIINAIVDTVSESGSLMSENCAMAVGRMFGFSRTGAKVKSRIEKALDIAVNKGLIDEDNGKLTIHEV